MDLTFCHRLSLLKLSLLKPSLLKPSLLKPSRLWVIGSLIAALAGTPAWAGSRDHQGPSLFRYKNEQGSLVTSYILPPEYVEKGYEIVTPMGDIIKKVPPAPSKEEREAMLKQERSAEEQALYDKKLRLKYGNLAELRQAQARKLDELVSKLSVLTSNLNNIQVQIEAQQYKAAGFERAGRPVPEIVLTALDELYGNLERTESLVRRRETEIDQEKKAFTYEMNRYKEIMGLR